MNQHKQIARTIKRLESEGKSEKSSVKKLKTALEKWLPQVKPDIFPVFLASITKKNTPEQQTLLFYLNELLKQEGYGDNGFMAQKNNYQCLKDLLVALAILKEALRFFEDKEEVFQQNFSLAKAEFSDSTETDFDNAQNANLDAYKNLSWLYEKAYITDKAGNKRTSKHVEVLNKAILKKSFQEYGVQEQAYRQTYTQNTAYSFCLQVGSRGLVLGTGKTHESGLADTEFKLGFDFDQLYGYPLIKASSIKGAIRAVFPKEIKDKSLNDEQKIWLEAQNELMLAYFKSEIFKNWKKPAGLECSSELLSHIENHLFENKNDKDPKNDKINIFYDAPLYRCEGKKMIKENNRWELKDKQNHIFDSQVISNEREAFKSPNLLHFLKVAAGAIFRFQFHLEASTFRGVEISSENYLGLLRQIILHTGLGAKTRIGLGQFREIESTIKNSSKA